jgi:hypothetical protein
MRSQAFSLMMMGFIANEGTPNSKTGEDEESKSKGYNDMIGNGGDKAEYEDDDKTLFAGFLSLIDMCGMWISHKRSNLSGYGFYTND